MGCADLGGDAKKSALRDLFEFFWAGGESMTEGRRRGGEMGLGLGLRGEKGEAKKACVLVDALGGGGGDGGRTDERSEEEEAWEGTLRMLRCELRGEEVGVEMESRVVDGDQTLASIVGGMGKWMTCGVITRIRPGGCYTVTEQLFAINRRQGSH